MMYISHDQFSSDATLPGRLSQIAVLEASNCQQRNRSRAPISHASAKKLGQ